MTRKLVAIAGIVLVLTLVLGGIALAQESTPESSDVLGGVDLELPLRLRQGGWAAFDAVADALHMPPTALFEALYDGKSLQEVAEVQGVDMSVVREAARTQMDQSARDRVQQALLDGKITQDHADWLLEGLDNGWAGGRRIAPRLRIRR